MAFSLSVIIPTYNRKDILKRCLTALFNQTYPYSDYEVIVVDDGSTDGTEELVKSMINNSPCELRYFKQENRGPAAARNVGIKEAEGEIILFIGDDIIADKNMLEEHIKSHKKYANNVAILGYITWPPQIKVTPFMEYLNQTGMQFGYSRIKDKEILSYNYFYTSNVSIKREFLLKNGLFDEKFKFAVQEDRELGYRLQQKGLKIVYNRQAVGYHFHPVTINKFCERQKLAGLSSALFYQKHPELKRSSNFYSIHQNIFLYRYIKTPICRALIPFFEKTKFKGYLYKLYDTVLNYYSLLGVKEWEEGNYLLKKVKTGLVSVVILNWNGMRYIGRCIESVLQQTYKNLEIIIIDNGSTDDSVELVKEKYPKVKLIKNKVNEGFCRANNTGFKLARGEYILPLNYDVILTKTFLEEMVRIMERYPNAGIVGGKLLSMTNKQTIDSTGHIILKNRVPLDRGRGEIDKGQYDREEPMFGISGAAPLYRWNMLEAIKINGEYFDESFFSYFEDVDIEWRAQLLGWSCIYTPKAVAYHYGGVTHLSRTREMAYHLFKNRFLMILKNDLLKIFLRDFRHILIKEIKHFFYVLLYAPYLFKAYFYVMWIAPQTLKKRALIQKKRVVSIGYMTNWFR